MDLVETETDFVLRADLPGMSESDVNIELDDNVLTISGERKAEHEDRKAGYYRVERSFGSFRRSLTLPEGVDPESVKATFDKGVLEVTVPKPAQRTPRKVQISVGGPRPQTIEGSRRPSSRDRHRRRGGLVPAGRAWFPAGAGRFPAEAGPGYPAGAAGVRQRMMPVWPSE